MKKFAIVGFLAVLAAAGIGPATASSVCPSPLPNCSSAGNASLLSGSFACVDGAAQSDGSQESDVVLVTFTPVGSGTGNVTGEVAGNQNNSTSGTYRDFTANTITGTYCINADNVTGYVMGRDCPHAFGLTSGHTMLRAINTAEGREDSLVCRRQ